MTEEEKEIKGRIEKYEEKPTKDGQRLYRVLKIGNVSGLAFGGIGKGFKAGDYVEATYKDDGKGIRFTKIWKIPVENKELPEDQKRLTEVLEEKVANEDFKIDTMMKMNAVKTAASLVDDVEDIEKRIDLFRSLRAEILKWLKEYDE